MNRYIVSIPASVSLVLEQDREPTEEDVADAVGKYVTLKNGQDFDSDEFVIIDSEEL